MGEVSFERKFLPPHTLVCRKLESHVLYFMHWSGLPKIPLHKMHTHVYIPFSRESGYSISPMITLSAFSYKNTLRITFDLFVVGNLLYEYRNYETAEICVSLYGTAQMIGFSSRIKHRTDHYTCICLRCSTPYLFKFNRRKTSQEHPSAKGRSSVLKALKTASTM